MQKLFIVVGLIVFLSACGNTQVSKTTDDNSSILTEQEMKTNSKFTTDRKAEIDQIVADIDAKVESMTTESIIASMSDGYGDAEIFYNDDSKEIIRLIKYTPGDESEYFYFDEAMNLIFIQIRKHSYQPWSLEMKNLYIDNGQVNAAYICTQTSDSEPCEEMELSDEQFVTNYEAKIADRLKSFTKSLKVWPKIEEALIKMAKDDK